MKRIKKIFFVTVGIIVMTIFVYQMWFINTRKGSTYYLRKLNKLESAEMVWVSDYKCYDERVSKASYETVKKKISKSDADKILKLLRHSNAESFFKWNIRIPSLSLDSIFVYMKNGDKIEIIWTSDDEFYINKHEASKRFYNKKLGKFCESIEKKYGIDGSYFIIDLEGNKTKPQL
ncbi:hypothetical protein AAEX28_07795 [Lentisphaerota bacterium WC36G]|nr:hypothetical protein LJT99_10650 [Lentisphaerae bacterium WC36]